MTLLDLTPPRQLASRLQGLPVAIIGAGPIGLAAAAQPRRPRPRLRGARGGRPRRRERRAVGAHPAVLAVEAPRRPGLAAPARRDGLGRAARRRAADRRRARRGLPATARRAARRSRRASGSASASPTSPAREWTARARRAGRRRPFLLRVRTADGVDELTARAVIDASGTYRTPNRLGSSGLDPLGLPEVADLVGHALPDVLGRERAAFAGGTRWSWAPATRPPTPC